MKKLILMIVLSFSIGSMCVEALASPNTGFGDGGDAVTIDTSKPSNIANSADCPLAFLGVPCGTTPAIPTRSGTCEVVPAAFISDESDSKEHELNKPIVPTYYAKDERLWIPFVEYKGEALAVGVWLALDDADKFGISSISEFDKTKNCIPKEVTEEKIVYQDVIKEVEKVVEKIVYRDRCTAPAGVEAFETEETRFYKGNVYQTTEDRLFIITGTTSSLGVGNMYISVDRIFRLAPASLPAPDSSSRFDLGIKGKYYFLHNGFIAYADFL